MAYMTFRLWPTVYGMRPMAYSLEPMRYRLWPTANGVRFMACSMAYSK